MKRIVLLVAVIGMVAGKSFAQQVAPSQNANKVQYTSFKHLGSYLQLQPEQVEEVYTIQAYFVDQLRQPLSVAAVYQNERPVEAQNALLCNLMLMHRVLTPGQYDKYLALMNVSRDQAKATINNTLLDYYLADK